MGRTIRATFAVATAVALLAAGCGDDDDGDDGGAAESTTTVAPDDVGDELPEITVVAAETEADGAKTYTFELPSDLTAGAASLNLSNAGSETHHAQVYRLGDDSTMDAVGAALMTENIPELLALGQFAGGTGVTDPGGDSPADAIVELEEGSYAMMCFLPDASGVPHLANGMVVPFEVGPAADDAAEAPEADLVVDAVDFGFSTNELPATGTIELANTSSVQIHELQLFKLADGATKEDVAAFFDDPASAGGPPPFTSAGGMQALMPGASGRVRMDLEPGAYAIVCLIPDPTDQGIPHYQKGMIADVTVS